MADQDREIKALQDAPGRFFKLPRLTPQSTYRPNRFSVVKNRFVKKMAMAAWETV